jgi:putative endonuclease
MANMTPPPEKTNPKQSLGRWGEQHAQRFLKQNGYSIRACNYRTRYGEIDIVAEKHEFLVFVEVKTRSSNAFGPPETAITPKKKKTMLQSALSYLQTYPDLDCDWQIDVISIQRFANQNTTILHFENVITE